MADHDAGRILDVVQLHGGDRGTHALECCDNALAGFEILQVANNFLEGIEKIRPIIRKTPRFIVVLARLAKNSVGEDEARFRRSGR